MSEKNILFVLPNLSHGGVERMTLSLSNKFTQDGFSCSIALREFKGELLPHLDSRVNIIELAPKNIIQFIPALSKIISKTKPTAVITAFPDIGLLSWIAVKLTRSKTKIIHGVHDTHSLSSKIPGIFGWVKYKYLLLLAFIIYYLADELVAVSQGLEQELATQFRINNSKVHVIYNPIIPDDFFERFHSIKPHKKTNDYVNIIAIGRLVHQKGFDLLIKSLSEVNTRHKWNLSIYGNGPEYQNLSKLILNLGLSSKIKLYGFTSDPFAKLAEADLFVMPSRHEGFGNVLVEALACETSVIAADCSHGPREILVNGEYGKLVPPENTIILSEAISDFLESKNIKYKSGAERASHFTFESSYSNWKKIISPS